MKQQAITLLDSGHDAEVVTAITVEFPDNATEVQRGTIVANALAEDGTVFTYKEDPVKPKHRSAVSKFVSLVTHHEPQLEDKILNFAYLDRAIHKKEDDYSGKTYKLVKNDQKYSRDSYWEGKEYKKPVFYGTGSILYRVRAAGPPLGDEEFFIDTQLDGFSIRRKKIIVKVPAQGIQEKIDRAVGDKTENGITYKELGITHETGNLYKKKKMALPVYMAGMTGAMFGTKPAHVYTIDKKVTYSDIIKKVIDDETRIKKEDKKLPVIMFNPAKHPAAQDFPHQNIPADELTSGIHIIVMYAESYDQFTEGLYKPVDGKYRLKLD